MYGVMKNSVCVGTLVHLFLLGVAWSDINTTFLPERPSATLPQAQAKAARESKAIFLILYDDRETVPNTLQYFFDSPRVKQQFKENFEVCVRDKRKKDVVQYDDPAHAWNRARFVVLTPSGENIYQGRFLRNDEAGMKEIDEAVQKWLTVKKTFQTKPGGPTNQSSSR
jgi:hypothetical protein